MKAHRFHKEDPGGWEEIPRTPEVQEYSKGLFGLIKRSTIMKLCAGLAAGYIAWVYIKYFGAFELGGEVTKAERRAAVDVSRACLVLILFFVIPIAINVFRPRLNRVSRRSK
ncbi:MAG: hypothetical protein AAB459_04315 [Patescibacteria group bacterium]|jgi:hypothetical protein